MSKEMILESIKENVPDDVVAGFSVFLKPNGAHTILTNLPLERAYVLLSAITHDMISSITESLVAVSETDDAKSNDRVN